MKIRTIRSHVWLLLSAIVFLCGALGCGYQLTGQSSYLAKNIQSIYVEPLISRTREIGIEKEMTSALRSEFYRRHQVRLVDDVEQADAIVTAVIRSVDTVVASVNSKDEVLQYETTMLLDVTLRRREPNEILWYGPNTRLTQLFAGSRAAVVTTSSAFRQGTLNTTDVRALTDIQLTEVQRQMARADLVDGFAKELHQRLVEMF